MSDLSLMLHSVCIWYCSVTVRCVSLCSIMACATMQSSSADGVQCELDCMRNRCEQRHLVRSSSKSVQHAAEVK